jgi:hypothetical protein
MASKKATTQANQADFLGQGTLAPQASGDPNSLPNPKNPGGISNNDLARLLALQKQLTATSTQRQGFTGAGLGGSPEQIAAAKAEARSKVVTAKADSLWKDLGTDTKKIWTSDPVTTGILAAPYGIAAGGILAGGAAGVAAGAGPGITTPITAPASLGAVGGMASPFAPGAAAPTLGAVGTVASPFAAGAAGAGGPAMFDAAAATAAAAKSGTSVLEWGKRALSAGLITKMVYDQITGGNSASQSPGAAGSGAPATPAVATNYGPSGGYLRPTASQGGSGASVASTLQSNLSGLSPEARNTLTQANQFPSLVAPTAQRATASPAYTARSNANVQQFMPSAPSNVSAAQNVNLGIQQQQQVANRAAQQNTAASQQYAQQGAASANRAAPQIAQPSQANQQSVYNAAGSFQPNTSGVAGIRAATADTSGAGRLENYQLDQQGIQNLEGFQSTNSQQGVNALQNFTPGNTQAGLGNVEGFYASQTNQAANQLQDYQSTNALQAAEGLRGFGAMNGGQAAGKLIDYQQTGGRSATGAANALGNFQSDQSGIQALQGFAPDMADRDALRGYAAEAQGPSQAQALLRAQADADARTALSIARSGRGTPASIAAAQRQAISEGAAIAGETRGQAAALSAQEFDTYKQRQLSAMGQAAGATNAADAQRLGALAQAGSLISASEAQRLQGLQASGQLLNQQDQLQLSALQAYAQVESARDAQMLSAQQSAGQLSLGADTNRLSGLQSAGQLRAAGDQMRLSGQQSGLQARSAMDSQLLSATSNAASLQGQMDAQRLGAISNAAQLRTQGDSIQSNNLQSAAGIRLQGSAINQQGQIAATQAELQGSAQQLQALGLQGQLASDMANQSVQVLKANLDANMQQLNLNDTQVRYFAGLGAQRDIASQAIQTQAAQFGVNAGQAQQALDLQYQQTVYNQLSQQQQLEYNYASLNSNNALGVGSQAISTAGQVQQNNQFNAQQSQQQANADRAFYGQLLAGISQL